VQKHVHGNSATATSASKLTTPRNIKMQGAISGNANFDGSTNITINTTQSNIAVLTGTGTIGADTTGTLATLNYPTGFTKDNCIVISCGLKINGGSRGFAFGYDSDEVFGMALCTSDKSIELSDNIRLSYKNKATSSKVIAYKIVLMKVL